jgi:predicted DNA binding protein
MATIADVVLPAEEFALQDTSQALDSVEFQAERVVASNADRVMPYVWIVGSERDTIEDALDADPSVENFALVTDLGSQRLYSMEWVDRIEALVRVIVDEQAVILAAHGTNEAWQLLFLDREAIRRVQDRCEAAGLAFDVKQIYGHGNAAMGARGLSETEHYVLALALERGYYDEPPGISAEALAAELDLTHRELVARLRQAHGALVSHSVSIGVPSGFSDARSDADD